MGFPAARINDMCTGHSGYRPRLAIQGSPDIFIDGRAVHRQSDRWASHSNGQSCHDGTLASGSSVIYANGLQQGRVTDPVTCGSRVATGSPDIFLN